MKTHNQNNNTHPIKLKRGFISRKQTGNRIYKSLANYFFIALVLLLSCDDFFEKDISDDRVGNLIPSSGWSSDNASVHFSWSPMEGATEYNFQMVSPSFDLPHELITDSTLSVNNLQLTLGNGGYEWKIRGQNSVSASNYSISSFEILSPKILPIPILPANRDTVKTNVVQFSWAHPNKTGSYKIGVFSDADLQHLVDQKEISDTTVFIELEKNGQYFWRINSIDQYNNQGDYSSTSTFYLNFDQIVDISNEEVVLKSPVSSGYISTTKISFWWDEVEGATDYLLQVVSPGFSEATNLIINEKLSGNSKDYELEEGDYQWRVKASNNNYSTGFTTASFKIRRTDISSELVSLTSPVDEAILKESEVNFKWEEIEGTEYQFILKKDNWESGTVLHQKTVSGNELTFTLPDGLYYWGVKAKDLINSTETEFSVRSFTLDNNPPETPIHVSPANNSEHSKGEIQFQWRQDNAEDGIEYTFKLYKENGSQNDLIYSYELSSTELYYNFNSTGTYYWQVMATDNAQNPGSYSSLSVLTISDVNDISNAVVILNAPYNGFTTTDTEISFWWEELDNAQNYTFQLVKPNFTNIEELVVETTVTNNKITLTLETGSYQWRVKAKNSSSGTNYSSANSITIQ